MTVPHAARRMACLRAHTVVPLALLAIVATGACMMPLKREKFEKIQLGMTEAEVEKITGKPNAVTKMDTYGDVPIEDYEQNHRRPEQFMWVYTSGMEFAQVYFEDKHVFGVRFNNEFLKGDWMEGDRLPADQVPQAYPGPSTAPPRSAPSEQAEPDVQPAEPASDEPSYDEGSDSSENP